LPEDTTTRLGVWSSPHSFVRSIPTPGPTLLSFGLPVLLQDAPCTCDASALTVQTFASTIGATVGFQNSEKIPF